MNRYLKLKLLGLLVLVSLSFDARLRAEILNIPEDFQTIQEAIDASSDNDTVLIHDGQYTENVELSSHPLTIGSQFLLDGDQEHIENTIWGVMEGERSTFSVLSLHDIAQGLTVVAGLSFNCSAAMSGGGISVRNVQEISIHDCVFHGIYVDTLAQNHSYYGGGLDAQVVDSIYIGNCLFGYLRAGFGGGANLDSVNTAFIEANLFRSNSANQAGGGLQASRSSGVLLRNKFSANFNYNPFGGPGGGVCLYDSSAGGGSWVLEANEFVGNYAGNGGGVFISRLRSCEIINNYFLQNYAFYSSFPKGGGCFIEAYANGFHVSGNIFRGNSSKKDAAGLEIASDGEVEGNVFTSNSAGTVGALYLLHSGDTQHVQVHDNLFTGTSVLDTVNYYAGVSAGAFTEMYLYNNDFYSNESISAGLLRPDFGYLEAANNYWGDPSGPYQEELNPGGMGDTVGLTDSLLPFSTEPFTAWRPPLPFDLLFPEPGGLVGVDSARFVWRAAVDPNEGDTVRYTFSLARDEAMQEGRVELDAGLDTTLVLDSLQLNHAYYWRVEARDTLGLQRCSEVRSLMVVAVLEGKPSTLPGEWYLHAPYPNPFNATVRVVVDAPERADLTLDIIDVLGRRVALLHQGATPAGQFACLWTPRDLASGVYLLRASSPQWTVAKKVVYLK